MKYYIGQLIGSKYGRLTILGEYQPGVSKKKSSNGKAKSATVLCKCDCGTIKRITLMSVIKGSTTSCGCLLRAPIASDGKRIFRKLKRKRNDYNVIESIAKDIFSKRMKDNPGDLSFEDFYFLSQQPCYYCGSGPVNEHRKYGNKNTEYTDGYVFKYNGLDRINSEIGYSVDNVVPCCKWCNFMKNTQSTQELFERIVKIILNHKEHFSKLGISLSK